ncbi:hypothetical protein Hanom_Chr15g01376961 [Helianthus anomalus]
MLGVPKLTSDSLVNRFANAGDTAVEIAGTTTFWVRAFFFFFIV